MELQRATKEGVLELDRISAKIGSTVNAVWGTIEGDITKQTDLQVYQVRERDDVGYLHLGGKVHGAAAGADLHKRSCPGAAGYPEYLQAGG